MAESKPEAIEEVQSVASLRSHSSTCSKANLEAIKAKVARKDIEINIEQARLQATFGALRAEQENEAAITEANLLEAGLLDLGFETYSKASSQALKETLTNISTDELPVKIKNEDVSPTYLHQHYMVEQDGLWWPYSIS